MTLTHARTIVRNTLSYSPREVREAAEWLLGTSEDFLVFDRAGEVFVSFVHDASHAVVVGARDL